jgi:hypothetical protein
MSAPVWIHESPELLEAAAEIKAKHRLSLADAWIAATTFLLQLSSQKRLIVRKGRIKCHAGGFFMVVESV